MSKALRRTCNDRVRVLHVRRPSVDAAKYPRGLKAETLKVAGVGLLLVDIIRVFSRNTLFLHMLFATSRRANTRITSAISACVPEKAVITRPFLDRWRSSLSLPLLVAAKTGACSQTGAAISTASPFLATIIF